MGTRKSDPLPTSFRRRFPLELTPGECELLERAGRAFESKRAALLSGLEALAEREGLRQALAAAEEEREAAREALAKEEKRARKLEADASKAKEEVEALRKRAQASARSERRALAQETAAIEHALARERELRLAAERELEDVLADFVEWLRCPRCGRFTGASEWETRDAQEGAIVYHGPCGFHQGGLLDPTTILGLRRS